MALWIWVLLTSFDFTTSVEAFLFFVQFSHNRPPSIHLHRGNLAKYWSTASILEFSFPKLANQQIGECELVYWINTISSSSQSLLTTEQLSSRCDNLTLHRIHIELLDDFHMPRFALSWKSNRIETTNTEGIILKTHFWWIRHVIRRDNNRIANQLLYIEHSKRKWNHRKNIYKLHQGNVGHTRIASKQLEVSAQDRNAWRVPRGSNRHISGQPMWKHQWGPWKK